MTVERERYEGQTLMRDKYEGQEFRFKLKGNLSFVLLVPLIPNEMKVLREMKTRFILLISLIAMAPPQKEGQRDKRRKAQCLCGYFCPGYFSCPAYFSQAGSDTPVNSSPTTATWRAEQATNKKVGA
jgi:hypothetical protein